MKHLKYTSMRIMYMCMFYIICLAIGLSLSVANSSTVESKEKNGTKLSFDDPPCFTKSGEAGFCRKKDLCKKLGKSESVYCIDDDTLCCPLSNTPPEIDDNNSGSNPSGTDDNNSGSNPSGTDDNNSGSNPSGTDDNNSGSNSSVGVDCGVRPANSDLGFIIGGTNAEANSYPWAAALYFNSGFICGATIISETWVLCAAHCILDPSPENFQVKVGAHSLSDSGNLVEVESVIVHELFDSKWMQNDLSLLKLKNPLDFSADKTIAPVCLPTKEMDENGNVGKISTIVGWGTMHEGGTPSDTLMQVHVPIISNSDCTYSYNSRMITKKQLCAGYHNGGKDACQGDSGGSLCLDIAKKYYQMGIVSWGRGCGEANSPGVYTRVSQFTDWISKNTMN